MADDPGYSLICAVRNGNVQAAKELIDTFGLSHTKAWSDGYNLLRDALQYKQQKVADLLLMSSSKINSKNNRLSTTPLHFAVKNGYTEIVAMLLEREAIVNARDHGSETPLHFAVERGSLEIVKLLMERKANVHMKSKNGMTPLLLAVQRGNLSIVEELLNHGAQINNCTQSLNESLMPLHCAVVQRNAAMVELLLRTNVEIDGASRDKRTPLHVAANMGQVKIVKLLLESGANVNSRDKNGKTVLEVAVEEAHCATVEQILLFQPDLQIEADRNSLYVAINMQKSDNVEAIVDALLRYGLAVRPEDAKNTKLMHTAVERGYLKVVDALLKLGADVNAPHTAKKSMTPLHTAALHFQPDIAKFLMSNGAKLDAKDNLGKSVIHYAIENHDLEMTKLLLNGPSGVEVTTDILHAAVKSECPNIVKILLKKTPNIDVNDCDKFGRTALHHTVLNEGWDFPSVIFFPPKKGLNNKDPLNARVQMAEMFLSRGACVNAKTKNGATPLHNAAESGYIKVVEVLLQHDADVNSLAEQRTTPLHVAAKRDYKAIVQMLLDSGANVNARQKNGTTPLHIASKRGHEEVVKLLVERGGSLNAKDSDKSTPLSLATGGGYADVVRTLLKFGASVDLKDKSGKTALHVAAKHGWAAVAEILLKHGANINVTCTDTLTPLDYAIKGTKEYNGCLDESLFGRRFDYHLDDDDDDDDDLSENHDYDCFSDPDYNDIYDYFADDYESASDCPCQEVAEVLEQHIVAMKAVDLYVSEKNLHAVDLQFEHRSILERCQIEIAMMKSKKIGDSSVTFYDILTRGMDQLAAFTRNQTIVEAFNAEDYVSEFPSYCGIIRRRFKQGQKRESLLCSSLKSLTALCGYNLPDVSAILLLNYLSNNDLENLISATSNIECES